MMNHRIVVSVLLIFVLLGSPAVLLAAYVTDGAFGSGEWGAPSASFPVVGSSGGADLYAAQDAGVIHVMVDYVNSSAKGFDPTVTSTFFDFLFQVGSKDFVVRVSTLIDGLGGFQPGGFAAYEKSHAVLSPLASDGSLDVDNSPWTEISSGNPDFDAGQFDALIGFDTSSASSTPHLMAEFQVNAGPTGLVPFDSTGFWSVSAFAVGVPDPPSSSIIFTLEPDGSLIILPALGSDGGPVQQSQQVAPEPSSIVLLIVGTLGIAGFARRRGRPRS